jgi:hypothetical protein
MQMFIGHQWTMIGEPLITLNQSAEWCDLVVEELLL